MPLVATAQHFNISFQGVIHRETRYTTYATYVVRAKHGLLLERKAVVTSICKASTTTTVECNSKSEPVTSRILSRWFGLPGSYVSVGYCEQR